MARSPLTPTIKPFGPFAGPGPPWQGLVDTAGQWLCRGQSTIGSGVGKKYIGRRLTLFNPHFPLDILTDDISVS